MTHVTLSVLGPDVIESFEYCLYRERMVYINKKLFLLASS